MRDRYRRLRALGFLPHVALALAEAGYDVVGFAPLGWVGLPLDEHLAHVGGASC